MTIHAILIYTNGVFVTCAQIWLFFFDGIVNNDDEKKNKIALF